MVLPLLASCHCCCCNSSLDTRALSLSLCTRTRARAHTHTRTHARARTRTCGMSSSPPTAVLRPLRTRLAYSAWSATKRATSPGGCISRCRGGADWRGASCHHGTCCCSTPAASAAHVRRRQQARGGRRSIVLPGRPGAVLASHRLDCTLCTAAAAPRAHLWCPAARQGCPAAGCWWCRGRRRLPAGAPGGVHGAHGQQQAAGHDVAGLVHRAAAACSCLPAIWVPRSGRWGTADDSRAALLRVPQRSRWQRAGAAGTSFYDSW